MARPPKTAADLAHALLRFRCTAAEKRRIAQHARRAGVPVSAYVRLLALAGNELPANDAAPRTAAPDPLLALVAAINRAGNLVNQQMAIAHGRGDFPFELLRADEELAAALKAVSGALAKSR